MADLAVRLTKILLEKQGHVVEQKGEISEYVLLKCECALESSEDLSEMLILTQ